MAKVLGDNPFGAPPAPADGGDTRKGARSPKGKGAPPTKAARPTAARGAAPARPPATARPAAPARPPATARPAAPARPPATARPAAPAEAAPPARAEAATSAPQAEAAASAPQAEAAASAPQAEAATSAPREEAAASAPPAPAETAAAETTAPASASTSLDAPDTVPPEEALEDTFYGAEAAPAPGDYGPGLDTRRELPQRRTITDEVRELERRVKASLTPAFPIEHRRRLPLEFLTRRYRRLALRNRSEVVDEFGRDPLVSQRVEPVLDWLYRKYFRVALQGVEHVPAAGRAVVVANHSGTLPYDGAMLMHAVRVGTASGRDLRPLVEDFLFHFPYVGTFINRIGGVRACQENAERLLDEGQLIAVFPEGILGIGKLFRDRYRLQRFGRGGFVKLALRTGAPIVPAAIVGAEEIQPMLARITWFTKLLGMPYVPVTPTFPLLGPLGLLPLPTKWTIRFGAPLDFAARYGPGAADDRILVNRLAETVRSTIQEMVDEVLAQRKSVLFG